MDTKTICCDIIFVLPLLAAEAVYFYSAKHLGFTWSERVIHMIAVNANIHSVKGVLFRIGSGAAAAAYAVVRVRNRGICDGGACCMVSIYRTIAAGKFKCVPGA